MATIEVTAQRSGNRWILHAPKPNSFASSATLADAPAAITRQIASDHDLDASTIDVNVTPVIDAEVSRFLDDLAALRRRTEESLHQQRELTAKAAHLLIEQMDLTYRDAAYLLEMSHQRVHQILSDRTNPSTKEWRTL